jgi:hypothetical protein
MRVAVTSTVIFEVPDDDVEATRRRFLEANEWAIGKMMTTVSGQLWIMRAIERLEVERRAE